MIADRLDMEVNSSWEKIEGVSSIPTFMRKGRGDENALQISWISIPKDKPVQMDVEEFAIEWAKSIGGVVQRTSNGAARYGKFGSAIFKAKEYPYCQVWMVSDGANFLSATFVCSHFPTNIELVEVQEMVLSLRPDSPTPIKKRWWKF